MDHLLNDDGNRRYEFLSRDSSSPTHHVDKIAVTNADGSITAIDRTVPKRVGKTFKKNRGK